MLTPSAPADAEIARRLRLLQLRFAAGLAQRRADLAAAWTDLAAIAAGRSDTAATGALCSLLHRLAGAAGAYGFESICCQARDLERQLLALPRRAVAPAATELAAPLAALLADMDLAIADAAAAERPCAACAGIGPAGCSALDGTPDA